MNPTPRFRTDLLIVEQTYRGEQTYIVKDPVSHKYFRFRPIEIIVMQSLDGHRTISEAAAGLAEEGVPVTAAALSGFAQSLDRMGLLEKTLGERTVLELERLRAERRSRQRKPLFRGSIMRMRWSVGDPDALFDRWMPRLRFFFTTPFFIASAVLFLAYLTVLVLKWGDFTAGVVALYTPSQFTPEKIAIIVVTTLGIIGIHELGHGVTCKHFGGKVHEMGAMLIYFNPAFYCNVNDAWTFPERSARLWVTAAGSWIQLVLAGIAALIWWAAVPGTVVSDVALTAVVVGGGLTVLANANPLIPLDGYYALSDWLEISNLRQRAFKHAGWLVRHKVLRLDVPEPPVAPDERRVLLIYGILAVLYICTILSIVALTAYGWISGALGAVAGLLFLSAVLLMLRGKILESWRTLRAAVREHGARLRGSPAVRKAGAGAALFAVFVLLLPWPITVSGGFTTLPAHTLELEAPEDAVVSQVLVREGMQVSAGAPLLRLRNLALERDAVIAGREADSLARVARIAFAAGDLGRAATLDAEHRSVAALAEGLAARAKTLTVRAHTAGAIISERPEELLGRHVAAGAPLLIAGATGAPEARVILRGAGASLVRTGQPVRLALHDGSTAAGIVESVAPAADSSSGTTEARVRIEDEEWRVGTRGTARITLRRSSIAGATLWRLRSGVRSDLLF
ncbi:MAG TPA: HlyD family efflux transporter periplasmic adaptor subunit [Gemmatimonadales bacterium]|nr:HlyD family efflux transporter periplasmic adaptor subunit [Gemmatimonadales bacterium]